MVDLLAPEIVVPRRYYSVLLSQLLYEVYVHHKLISGHPYPLVYYTYVYFGQGGYSIPRFPPCCTSDVLAD